MTGDSDECKPIRSFEEAGFPEYIEARLPPYHARYLDDSSAPAGLPARVGESTCQIQRSRSRMVQARTLRSTVVTTRVRMCAQHAGEHPGPALHEPNSDPVAVLARQPPGPKLHSPLRQQDLRCVWRGGGALPSSGITSPVTRRRRPLILKGYDLVGIAETGSGATFSRAPPRAGGCTPCTVS